MERVPGSFCEEDGGLTPNLQDAAMAGRQQSQTVQQAAPVAEVPAQQETKESEEVQQ
jgi:hypothetical protein